MKLEPEQREALVKQFDPGRYVNGSPGQAEVIKIRILLSIDARLAETNDFYLQNHEERVRNERG